jgi:hypothetical protein
VFIFGGVYSLAHFAVRHPHSLIGRTLHSAGRVAAECNPYGGFGPTLVCTDRLSCPQGQPQHVDGIPDDPTPIEEPGSTGQPAPIVIPDEEPAPAPEQENALLGALNPVQLTGPMNPDAECPPGTVVQAAPTVMPYCIEEDCEEPATSQYEQLGMPCSEEYDPAPMPQVEEEQESAPEDSCPVGAAEKLLRLFDRAVRKSCQERMSENPDSETPVETPAGTPDCREDSNYHHHYSGCPYTGRSHMHCPRDRCLPPVTPAAEQPKTEQPREQTETQSLLEQIRQLWLRGPEVCPHHPGVDTMEHRPSDRPLSEIGGPDSL